MATPMAYMAAATVVSTGLQIYSNSKQNELMAESARKQKEFLKEQKILINKSKERDLVLFQRQVDEVLGQQEVGYAVAGVEFSDSAVRAAQQVIGLAEEEKIAIEEQAAANVALTDYKINVQSMSEDFYRNIGTYQTIGLGLGGVGQLARYSMKPYNLSWFKG
jgi:hypothetical protein